jgi:hypothetical protein
MFTFIVVIEDRLVALLLELDSLGRLNDGIHIFYS